MLKDVVAVRPVGGTRLYLRFEDGVEGTIDVATLVEFQGVFGLLKDPDEFARVYVNEELGSIEWPNGADLDPDVLYLNVATEDERSRTSKAS